MAAILLRASALPVLLALPLRANAAAAAGWHVAGFGESCDSECESQGLLCTEEQFHAHNGEIDSDVEVAALFSSLAGVQCTSMPGGYGTGSDVPVSNPQNGRCYQSSSSRDVSTFDCTKSTANNKRRLCYCHEGPSAISETSTSASTTSETSTSVSTSTLSEISTTSETVTSVSATSETGTSASETSSTSASTTSETSTSVSTSTLSEISTTSETVTSVSATSETGTSTSETSSTSVETSVAITSITSASVTSVTGSPGVPAKAEAGSEAVSAASDARLTTTESDFTTESDIAAETTTPHSTMETSATEMIVESSGCDHVAASTSLAAIAAAAVAASLVL